VGVLELQLRDAGGFSIVSTDDAFHATAISCGVFIRVYFLLNRSIYNQFNESYSTAQRHFLHQLLLDAGADVNAPVAYNEGRTALQAAAEKGEIEMVQVLLAANADVNALPAQCAGVTALQVSAIKGYLGIAIILLNAGADVNAKASLKRGRTALEGAAEHGRIDMVQLLLNAGVELGGSGNAQYREAMQLASKYGHNAVRKLIKAHYERGGKE
jgi:ankyrin repeat protein